jgi:hypothetical protein
MATAEYLEQNPLPTPEFWDGVSWGTMIDGSPDNCVSIKQFVLHSDTTARLTIDGKASVEVESWFYTGARLDAPTPYAGYKSYCFSIEDFSVGLHLAAIEVSTTSGEQYLYKWALRISEEMLTPEPLQLPTLAPLPSLTPSPATS